MYLKFAPFKKAGHRGINFKDAIPKDTVFQFAVFPIAVFVLFIILLSRLFQLTIVKGAYYRYIAENNRIKELPIEGERGKIIDRKGVVVAQSEKQMPKHDKDPVVYTRIYKYEESLAHILGYRQIASEKDLITDACQIKLDLNDRVGKGGIEKLYECKLRPKKGKRLIEVDAKGKYRKTLALLPSKPGGNIQISLDSQLQEKTYEIIQQNKIRTNKEIDLSKQKIAVVASKPQTGEILMILSLPTFSPSAFEKGDGTLTKQYIKDESMPLFNRALQGVYPPGSTIKPIIAAAALTEKAIDKSFVIEDTGTIKAGPLTFGNWFFLQYGRTDGMVDVVKGLRRSNDIFFYKTGGRLGISKINKWAHNFGLGLKTGIGLPEEEGLVPSTFWKKETIKDRWYLGDTYNLSIGQGYILTTPLQMNLATAVFANNGQLCRPLLLKENGQGKTCKSLGIEKETLRLVRNGMKQACEAGGTGWPFFEFAIKDVSLSSEKPSSTSAALIKKIKVGCKTGTSESHSKSSLPHAWFTVFAPYDNPEIVLTILVEESGEGSNIAAPIAKEVLKYYFERGQ